MNNQLKITQTAPDLINIDYMGQSIATFRVFTLPDGVEVNCLGFDIKGRVRGYDETLKGAVKDALKTFGHNLAALADEM